MAHYLVYIPAVHFEAAEKSGRHPLEHVGLSDHVPDAMGVRLTGATGPDHKGGQLYGWIVPTAEHRLNYNAEQQEWLPAVPDPNTEAAAQRYWLGFWQDTPATPRDLIRSKTVPGNELALGESGRWIIPHPQQLPCTIALSSSGQWVPQVDERYAEYNSTVKTLRNSVVSGVNEFENNRLFDFCLESLRVNYRMTREVAARLKLFTTESTVQIARLAIGLSEDGL